MVGGRGSLDDHLEELGKGDGDGRRDGRRDAGWGGKEGTTDVTKFGTLGRPGRERRRRWLFQVGRGGMGAQGGFIQTVC